MMGGKKVSGYFRSLSVSDCVLRCNSPVLMLLMLNMYPQGHSPSDICYQMIALPGAPIILYHMVKHIKLIERVKN